MTSPVSEIADSTGFGRDVSVVFFAQVINVVLATISSVIVSRALGPQGKGIYSLALIIPAMAASLAGMGISVSGVYFLGKKKYPEGIVAGNSLFYSISLGGVAVFSLFLLYPFLDAWILKGIPRIYLYIVILTIPFLLLFDNAYYLLLASRSMRGVAFMVLARPTVYLLALSLSYLSLGLTVYAAIWANVLGLAAGLLAGLFFLASGGFLRELKFSSDAAIEALKFGLKQHLGSVFQLLNYRLDMLIVAALLHASDIGRYSVAVLLAETLWYVPNALGQVLFPKTAASDRREAGRFSAFVSRIALFCVAVAALTFGAACGWLVPWLFTPRFLASVQALRLLLPGVVFLSLSKILGSHLAGDGHPQYPTLASFLSMLAAVILNIVLIPRMGINGASLATSAAYLVNAAVILYFFRKTSGIPFSEALLLRTGDLRALFRSVENLRGITNQK